ncbi:Mov34/MPN/PAD-1 family protein [Ancylostoma ceylanicum]|uniref:Mov34/MPN/PAD-1 family protein n=1 Tax=Ancylostoma ceylanicum TaxID=53326 RepID=A0A0D6LGE3_9BILA|nr:Mov34/MPN/PAD-1 family protein [Ancylostoma ceylanicum]
MERFLRLGGLGGGLGQFGGGPPSDSNQVDTSETVYISSLALLKMLKHGRAGVPMEGVSVEAVDPVFQAKMLDMLKQTGRPEMVVGWYHSHPGFGCWLSGVDVNTQQSFEALSDRAVAVVVDPIQSVKGKVMGLMLGEFVDEYTVNVIDVFAMPQSGTGVSVEAVDPVFQAKMLDMLKQTGRPEMVVGWYHSHPGFGCWLSGVDVNTQQSFEALSDRAVAVVVDPIQSVKGKVVIDAFRTINPQTMALNQEPRQTTSNLGHLQKPSIQMLLNLNKQSWMDSLAVQNYTTCSEKNKESMQAMLKLAKLYKKALEDEEKMTDEELAIKNVGKQDPKRHLGEEIQQKTKAWYFIQKALFKQPQRDTTEPFTAKGAEIGVGEIREKAIKRDHVLAGPGDVLELLVPVVVPEDVVEDVVRARADAEVEDQQAEVRVGRVQDRDEQLVGRGDGEDHQAEAVRVLDDQLRPEQQRMRVGHAQARHCNAMYLSVLN